MKFKEEDWKNYEGKMRNKGSIIYVSKGEGWTINYDEKIKVVRQPRGYYCEKCIESQHKSDFQLMWEDGENVKFWTQCKECKLKSSRSAAAKRWTEVLKEIDPELNHIRMATFTMKNPTYDLQEIIDPFGFEWNFPKDLDKLIKRS